MKKKLAIIPARSGSKGVSNKNIKNFYGIPLLSWAIIFARQADFFDDIIVSTDSDEYAKIAMKYGASVPYLRPTKIASDTSNIVDTVEDIIVNSEKDYDLVALLEPTSPLRHIEDLMRCSQLIQDKEVDSVFTVSPVDVRFHPDKQFFINNDSCAEFVSTNGKTVVNRQELNTTYIKNGVSYIFKTKSFLENRKILCGNIKAHIINRKLVNIDTLNDFTELMEFQKNNLPFDYIKKYLDENIIS